MLHYLIHTCNMMQHHTSSPVTCFCRMQYSYTLPIIIL